MEVVLLAAFRTPGWRNGHAGEGGEKRLEKLLWRSTFTLTGIRIRREVIFLRD